MFAVGFAIGYYLVRRMFLADGAPEAWLDSCFLALVLGTVLGARFGHVVFYEWDYYSQHPAEILQIWRGGLASHGGFVGIMVALWAYSRFITKRPMLWIIDKVAVPVALVGFFIRTGNLMNSEIVGLPTDKAWGFLFVNAVRGFDDVARHPVQIYEALGYLASFVLLYYVYWHTDKREKPGYVFGLFLVLIFGTRIVWEFFKTDQGGFQDAFGNILSTGQLLSIPLVLLGLWFMLRPAPRRSTAVQVYKEKK